jgi:hypothetical protein
LFKNSILYIFVLEVGMGEHALLVGGVAAFYLSVKVFMGWFVRRHPAEPLCFQYRMALLFGHMGRLYFYWEYFPVVIIYAYGIGAKCGSMILLYCGAAPALALFLATTGSFGLDVFGLTVIYVTLDHYWGFKRASAR